MFLLLNRHYDVNRTGNSFFFFRRRIFCHYCTGSKHRTIIRSLPRLFILIPNESETCGRIRKRNVSPVLFRRCARIYTVVFTNVVATGGWVPSKTDINTIMLYVRRYMYARNFLWANGKHSLNVLLYGFVPTEYTIKTYVKGVKVSFSRETKTIYFVLFDRARAVYLRYCLAFF